MKTETKRQVSERLEAAKRNLMEAVRVANTDPRVSKHLVRAINRMIDDCAYEQQRVAG